MTKFELNKKEEELAEAFKEEHKKCRPNKEGELFLQYAPYSYIFTPTGIGNCVYISCPYCGEKRNITDVSDW